MTDSSGILSEICSGISTFTRLIDVICWCITSFRIKVLWNGEALEHKVWNPIRLSRRGPLISHLAFADDLILFAEASLEQVELISSISDIFCKSSGQNISKEKSRVFFSRNGGWHKKHELSESSGIKRGFGKASWSSIPSEKVTRHTCQFVVVLDKVNQRLSSWKCKTLSFAGLVPLTKLVLQALPSYVMQTVLLPQSVCEDIDRICRKFIWDQDNASKRHLISWDVVCTPKKFAGLGLRKMRSVNPAYMMRANWRFCTQHHCLWSNVIRQKYKCGVQLLPVVNKCTQRTYATYHHFNGTFNRKVASFVHVNGNWQLRDVVNCLPAHIIESTSTILPPHPRKGDDALAWKLTSYGLFSLATAYDDLIHRDNHIAHLLYKLIWRWKISHECLLNNANRCHRRMATNDDCPMCNNYVEDHFHECLGLSGSGFNNFMM